MKNDFYGRDLARIHAEGFGSIGAAAGELLVKRLREKGLSGGLAIDLGCGDGCLSRVMVQHGFQVLGFDASASMIELARKALPGHRFVESTIEEAPLEECDAVAAAGEVFSYMLPGHTKPPCLPPIFERIHAKLRPQGVFLFDVCTPARVPGWRGYQSFREGTDWAVASEVTADPDTRILTRKILSFVREGNLFRRDEEVHRQFLYHAEEVEEFLNDAGFRFARSGAYGDARLPAGTICYECVRNQ